MSFEENEALWNLCIPGRDNREGELTMVPDEIKEALNTESLDKFMHMGVLAYSASSYLLDVLESLYGIEDTEKRDELIKVCINRVVQDLIFGAEGSYVNAWTEEEEYINQMIGRISHAFEGAREG